MTIGPIEYIIVGFPGNQFTGQIAPALADLIDNDTIRILDLVFISKDAGRRRDGVRVRRARRARRLR